jgi:hypothetical protein
VVGGDGRSGEDGARLTVSMAGVVEMAQQGRRRRVAVHRGGGAQPGGMGAAHWAGGARGRRAQGRWCVARRRGGGALGWRGTGAEGAGAARVADGVRAARGLAARVAGGAGAAREGRRRGRRTVERGGERK